MFEHTITAVEVILIAILYMLPTFLAYARDIPSKRGVTVLNIILGWTLVVWVILFVWALTARPVADEFA